MFRRSASLAFVVALMMLGSSTRGPVASGEAGPSAAGGTLRIGFAQWPYYEPYNQFDPQIAYFGIDLAWLRCCLVRTLLSPQEPPPVVGGPTLLPDLATEMPDISRDGLTWTFHLRRGLHYAPPFEAIEITSHDFVRALEREARVGAYPFYYLPIRGFDDFSRRRASGISGLETPDDHTLKIQLLEPTGDLGYRMSLPAAAPIPPGLDGRDSAADGHADYGPFLATTGPYMWATATRLNPQVKPSEQLPMFSKFDTRWTWVRNPSWEHSTDVVRAAIPDTIEFVIAVPGPAADSYRQQELWNKARVRVAAWVREGRADITLDPGGVGIPHQRGARALSAWLDDPAASPRVARRSTTGTHFIALNVAMPPFDSVRVRRAVAMALDRAGYWDGLADWGIEREPRPHLIDDALEGDLLSGYEPYTAQPAIGEARQQMKGSRYDADHDGRCDARACRHVTLEGAWGRAFHVLVSSLERIGLNVVFSDGPHAQMVNAGVGPDWPSPSSMFIPLLMSTGLLRPHTNQSMVGATAEQLRSWGYPTTKVPSMDQRIKACQQVVGPLQTWCWARLDQYEVERLVALIPLDDDIVYWGTSDRVTDLPFGSDGIPVLDAIKVRTS